MLCSSFILISSFQVYIIQVSVGNHQWTVKHRYSDFHDLHEKVRLLKLWPWSLTKHFIVCIVPFYGTNSTLNKLQEYLPDTI